MVIELRNVVKQDTGVLLQQDGLLNLPSFDGLSVIILSGLKLGGPPSTNTGLQTSAKTVSDRVDAISSGFIDTAILLHACGDFLYAEIAKQLDVGQPFCELRGMGYDFQEMSDLATHFAEELERLCPTGLIPVGRWSFGG